MSRKHFVALAQQLRNVKPSTDEREQFAQWVRAVDAISAAARHFNPRFDANRFRVACGIN